MTPVMIGPILLLAAMVSPQARPESPVPAPAAAFRSIGGATARATVSIRIISGIGFGSSYLGPAPGASRRAARIADRDGQSISAELLEFQ